jgi:hypothetical protein
LLGLSDFFEYIKITDAFSLVYPVGTIIGRAEFQNYLVIYQNGRTGGGYGKGKCFNIFKFLPFLVNFN